MRKITMGSFFEKEPNQNNLFILKLLVQTFMIPNKHSLNTIFIIMFQPLYPLHSSPTAPKLESHFLGKDVTP